MRNFCLLLLLILILLSSGVFAQQSVAAKNRYKVAKNMFSAARYADAEKELYESLKLDGKYSDALFLMGLTKWQLKQYDEAVKYLEQVIRQEPKYYTARLYLASVCLEKDEIARAEEQVKFYMSNQPSDPSGYYAMGVIHYKKGDLTKSVEMWDKAISVDKNHASSYYNKALALYLLDKNEDALFALNKAFAIKTANTNLYRFAKGCINYETGKKEEGLKDIKYLSELIPATVIGLTCLAILSADKEDWDEALQNADSALKLDPLFQKALEIKALALENKGDIDGALTCLETILKNDINQKKIEKRIKTIKEKANEDVGQ